MATATQTVLGPVSTPDSEAFLGCVMDSRAGSACRLLWSLCVYTCKYVHTCTHDNRVLISGSELSRFKNSPRQNQSSKTDTGARGLAARKFLFMEKVDPQPRPGLWCFSEEHL